MTTLCEGGLPSPATRRPSRPPKRFVETVASGSPSKRAKPVQLARALPGSSSSWVSCDNCDKWRRVAHAQEPTTAKWYCSDNLDAEHSACSVPQEMSDAAIDVELNQIQAAAVDAGGTTGVNEAAPRRKQAQCEHGRQRSQCKECGGSSICQHGRQRSQCIDCKGVC